MPRIKTLKPRIAALDVGRRLPSAPAIDSWRAGKTTGERGYNYRWQQARDSFLREHPLCEYCKQQGFVVAASVVDHIVPHQGDSALFWDTANWQPLCKPCHDTVKAKEEGRAGRKSGA